MKAPKAILKSLWIKLLFYPFLLLPHISNQITFKLLFPLNSGSVSHVLYVLGFMVSAFDLLLLQVLLTVCEFLNAKISFR